ncbi:MAG: NFACT family protein [Treponema sp.]|nr:NFACT family protein [Spirochaetia bacterium]MDD7274674.1 NFACT family protein [Treponema sp.]MDY3755761.1 NFACT family protein [Treponema sp.]
MSLNWKEIDCILEELELDGSFIQQIVQPSYDTIAFHTYKNGQSKTILVCLAAGACRIHQTWSAVPKNNKPLRFMEFLKARIKGARINSICQLGQERIIKLELSHCGQEFLLYIRLWSNAANMILTDTNHVVLDTFYRRPKKDEVSGGTFQEPNLQPKPQGESSKEWQVRSFDQLPDWENLSFNQKVEQWYGEHAGQLSLEALLEQAEKFYNSRHSKMEAALHRLEKKRDEFLQNQQWKHYGDLILTYGHLIDGSQDYLECEDYESGALIRIKIDPKKNAQENASFYYNTYKKTVSGLADLEHDIQKAKKELLDLEATYQQLCKEPNPLRLQQMLRKQTTPKQQVEKKRPGLSYQVDDWTILVGRTAAENDELLRRHVKGLDMWFHTRDYAGGYVFVKNRPGKTIPLSIMLCAGNLAVYHSKARKAGKADLYYTQVKHLRRAKDGPKGLVLPSQEKNLLVQLDKEILQKLEAAATS